MGLTTSTNGGLYNNYKEYEETKLVYERIMRLPNRSVDCFMVAALNFMYTNNIYYQLLCNYITADILAKDGFFTKFITLFIKIVDYYNTNIGNVRKYDNINFASREVNGNPIYYTDDNGLEFLNKQWLIMTDLGNLTISFLNQRDRGGMYTDITHYTRRYFDNKYTGNLQNGTILNSISERIENYNEGVDSNNSADMGSSSEVIYDKLDSVFEFMIGRSDPRVMDRYFCKLNSNNKYLYVLQLFYDKYEISWEWFRRETNKDAVININEVFHSSMKYIDNSKNEYLAITILPIGHAEFRFILGPEYVYYIGSNYYKLYSSIMFNGGHYRFILFKDEMYYCYDDTNYHAITSGHFSEFVDSCYSWDENWNRVPSFMTHMVSFKQCNPVTGHDPNNYTLLNSIKNGIQISGIDMVYFSFKKSWGVWEIYTGYIRKIATNGRTSIEELLNADLKNEYALLRERTDYKVTKTNNAQLELVSFLIECSENGAIGEGGAVVYFDVVTEKGNDGKDVLTSVTLSETIKDYILAAYNSTYLELKDRPDPKNNFCSGYDDRDILQIVMDQSAKNEYGPIIRECVEAYIELENLFDRTDIIFSDGQRLSDLRKMNRLFTVNVTKCQGQVITIDANIIFIKYGFRLVGYIDDDNRISVEKSCVYKNIGEGSDEVFEVSKYRLFWNIHKVKVKSSLKLLYYAYAS